MKTKIVQPCEKFLREAFADSQVELAKARAELRNWETWGMIEIMVRNPNVAEYAKHWEARAHTAEHIHDEIDSLRGEYKAEIKISQPARAAFWMARIEALDTLQERLRSALAKVKA